MVLEEISRNVLIQSYSIGKGKMYVRVYGIGKGKICKSLGNWIKWDIQRYFRALRDIDDIGYTKNSLEMTVYPKISTYTLGYPRASIYKSISRYILYVQVELKPRVKYNKLRVQR
jgi:hypothetical protein